MSVRICGKSSRFGHAIPNESSNQVLSQVLNQQSSPEHCFSSWSLLGLNQENKEKNKQTNQTTNTQTQLKGWPGELTVQVRNWDNKHMKGRAGGNSTNGSQVLFLHAQLACCSIAQSTVVSLSHFEFLVAQGWGEGMNTEVPTCFTGTARVRHSSPQVALLACVWDALCCHLAACHRGCWDRLWELQGFHSWHSQSLKVDFSHHLR